MHVHAFDGGAELPAVCGLRRDERRSRAFQIGIGFDDRGCLAAEFERRLRDVRLAVVEHLAARVHAARERDHPDRRMRAQRLGRRMIHRQDVDDARREARVVDGFRDLECRHRRVVARPHDHRVAGDQRRRDLAQQRVDRIVERDQARDDADRLAVQEQVLVGRVARNDFTFDPARPFGVIARDLARVDGFVRRVLDALAGFPSQRRADLRCACGERIGETMQVRRALGARQRAPALLRGGGRGGRSERVGRRRGGHARERRFGGGIVDDDERVAFRDDEAAVHVVAFGSHEEAPPRGAGGSLRMAKRATTGQEPFCSCVYCTTNDLFSRRA